MTYPLEARLCCLDFFLSIFAAVAVVKMIQMTMPRLSLLLKEHRLIPEDRKEAG